MTKELESICKEVDSKISRGLKVSTSSILENLGLNDESEFAMEAYRSFAKEYSGLASYYFSERNRLYIASIGSMYNLYKIGLFGLVGSLFGTAFSEGSFVGVISGTCVGLLVGFLSERLRYRDYDVRGYIEHQIQDLDKQYQEKRKKLLEFYGMFVSSRE